MNYLKTSLIGISATAALLVGTALANAQVAGGSVTAYGNANGSIIIPSDSSTITAVGSAGSPVFYVPTSSLTASQIAVNAVPTNYRPGYYNYPGYIMTSSNYTTPVVTTAPINTAVYSNLYYPGVPNTGGAITVTTTGTNTGVTNSGGFTTANPATGTYIAPMTSYNGMGITGGVSVPVGYTPAVGPNGSILTTNNSSVNTYPGVPNTGGAIVNGTGTLYSGYPVTNLNATYLSNGAVVNMTAGGLVQVNGIVTAVTPSAIAISSGSQTWTVSWNTGTSVSSSNGSSNVNGAMISIGDNVQVTGTLDSTFVSKINATSITDLSR
jgi:hypothetical protein